MRHPTYIHRPVQVYWKSWKTTAHWDQQFSNALIKRLALEILAPEETLVRAVTLCGKDYRQISYLETSKAIGHTIRPEINLHWLEYIKTRIRTDLMGNYIPSAIYFGLLRVRELLLRSLHLAEFTTLSTCWSITISTYGKYLPLGDSLEEVLALTSLLRAAWKKFEHRCSSITPYFDSNMASEYPNLAVWWRSLEDSFVEKQWSFSNKSKRTNRWPDFGGWLYRVVLDKAIEILRCNKKGKLNLYDEKVRISQCLDKVYREQYLSQSLVQYSAEMNRECPSRYDISHIQSSPGECITSTLRFAGLGRDLLSMLKARAHLRETSRTFPLGNAYLKVHLHPCHYEVSWGGLGQRGPRPIGYSLPWDTNCCYASRD